jgi:outer membrane scaffolding protein for murein synthesis (MipA/OmpV family)
MRKAPSLTAGTAMIGALLSSGLALAQPASTGDVVSDPVDTGPGQGMNFTLGAGAGAAPDYEGSDDYELVPLWNLRVANLYHPSTFVQVIGPRLRSNFLPSDHWRLGLSGQFIKERDDVENDQVDALEKVDPSAMLGVLGGYDFLADPQQHLMLEVEARQDVANDNGFLASVRGLYGGRLTERWRFDALVGSTWASEDYMSSYFGIDAADAARSGLDQFSADEGFKDVSFGGGLSYRLFERLSVSVLANYTRLIDDAEDSPVVDDAGDENQFFGGALVNYTF